MSIEARPLITRSLKPLENRLEVLIAESRLAYCATDDAEDIEEGQLMTVLVSFDPAPAQRWSARALAATFIAARCQFEQLPQGHKLDDWLIDLIDTRESASLCIVFSLPQHTADLEKEIGLFLSGLREAQRHHLHLTVAVSQSPIDWKGCTEIDGFILAEAQERDSAVLQVFNMLAALMAPGMSVCVDAEDLRPVFGFADQPSRIATGVWLPSVEVFEVARHEDRQMLEASSRVAFMPSTPLSLSSQIKLLNAVRKSAAYDTEFVMMGPYGMSTEPTFVGPVVHVSLVISAHPYVRIYEKISMGDD